VRDPAGPFAHDTITNRLPLAILSRTVQLNAHELSRCAQSERSLQGLIETLVDGDNRRIALPEDGASDLVQWWEEHLEPMVASGMTWTQAPWFTSETLAYRHALAAIGYYDRTRPLYGHDLFGNEKWEGMSSSLPRLRELVAEHEHEAAIALERKAFFPVLISLLHASLWGNQADSSLWTAGAHPELAGGSPIGSDGGSSGKVLVDDSAVVAAELLAGDARGRGRIVLVCDNSGMELVCDLLLARWLLSNGLASHIELLVKPCPFYVSDATCDDVHLTLSTLAADEHPALSRLGDDLLALSVTQKLSVREDEFWSSPLAGWEMPSKRRNSLETARLVIVKGDLQYRKLIGNRSWPATTPFDQIVSGVAEQCDQHRGEMADFARGFPAPLLSMRTLKAPLVVGLQSSVVSRLDKTYGSQGVDSDWRVQGTFGTIHYVPHRGPDRDAELL
jgi:hypothetical protein